MSEARVLWDPNQNIWDIPLDELDPSRPEPFENNTQDEVFARLRKEAPVHFCKASDNGPYWSVTKFNDIMHVDTNHQIYSSEGGITISEEEDRKSVV